MFSKMQNCNARIFIKKWKVGRKGTVTCNFTKGGEGIRKKLTPKIIKLNILLPYKTVAIVYHYLCWRKMVGYHIDENIIKIICHNLSYIISYLMSLVDIKHLKSKFCHISGIYTYKD